MKYSNAKRILTTKPPNLISRQSREQAGVHRITLYWVLSERKECNECIELLNKYTWPSNYEFDSSPEIKTVNDPESLQDTHEGVWRNIGATYSEEDGEHRVIIVLEAEINTSAPITEETSQWRQKGGKSYKSGSRNVVLELLYCDPETVQEMADSIGSDSTVFVDSIYTVNGGLLEGKWYHVDATYQIDSETGYGTILWYIRNHDNEDIIFTHMASPSERIVDFFKLNMPMESSSDFVDTYYFDSLGNFFVSEDGISYTNKNGEAVSPPELLADLSTPAYTLSETVNGRTVSAFNPAPEDEKGEIDLRVRIVFSESTSYDGGEDPDSISGRKPLMTTGYPEHMVRFYGRYVTSELPSDEMLLGRYEDIPAAVDGTYGTHGILSGRRLVVPRTSSERVTEDGSYEYMLHEDVFTVPINDEDEWFFDGNALGFEENEMRLKTVAYTRHWNDGRADSLDATAYMLTVPRFKPTTIKRSMKFFIKRPTDLILTAAGVPPGSIPGIVETTIPGEPVTYANQPDDDSVIYKIGGGGRNFWLERIEKSNAVYSGNTVTNLNLVNTPLSGVDADLNNGYVPA